MPNRIRAAAVTATLALALLLSGCGGILSSLLRLPSQTDNITAVGVDLILCEAWQLVTDHLGVPQGIESWGSVLFNSPTLNCARQGSGGNAIRLFIPSSRQDEIKQARKMQPGSHMTVVAELVTSTSTQEMQVRTPVTMTGEAPESFPVGIPIQTNTLVVRSLRNTN